MIRHASRKVVCGFGVKLLPDNYPALPETSIVGVLVSVIHGLVLILLTGHKTQHVLQTPQLQIVTLPGKTSVLSMVFFT